MPSAMAGWGDLVGILIFLLISGWINYSRRKKAEEEAQGLPGPRPAGQAPEAGSAAPARRTASHAGEDDGDEGWDPESWEGEHGGQWDEPDARENRSREARYKDAEDPEKRSGEARAAESRLENLTRGRFRPVSAGGAAQGGAPEAQRDIPRDRDEAPKPKAPPAVDKAREKASEMGRDLLTQIAKELGLELPKPEKPPTPSKQPATPSAPAPESRAPVRAPSQPPRVSPGPDAIRARAVEEARARTLQATPATAAAAARRAAAVPAPGAEILAAAGLDRPEALRQAFILKTILDRPVSLRPPAGPGPSAGG